MSTSTTRVGKSNSVLEYTTFKRSAPNSETMSSLQCNWCRQSSSMSTPNTSAKSWHLPDRAAPWYPWVLMTKCPLSAFLLEPGDCMNMSTTKAAALISVLVITTIKQSRIKSETMSSPRLNYSSDVGTYGHELKLMHAKIMALILYSVCRE